MVRILVPPGIGDIYWVLVKLQGFLDQQNLKDPELTVVSYENAYGGHLRGIPFLELCSQWLTIGNPPSVPNAPGLEALWNEAYLAEGRSIFPGIMGYDYFISYNGRVNSGGYIENDDIPCNWRPPIHWQRSEALPFPYVVLFFPFYGTYEPHEYEFPIARIAEALNKFIDKYGLVPVFIGSEWDKQINMKLPELMTAVHGSVDVVGKLNLPETLELVRNSHFVFGYHAGITNLAAVMRKKTLLLWDDRFPESTSYAVVSPDVRGTTYRWLPTKGLTVERVVKEMETMYESAP